MTRTLPVEETDDKALLFSGKGFLVSTGRFSFWCNGRALILSPEMYLNCSLCLVGSPEHRHRAAFAACWPFGHQLLPGARAQAVVKLQENVCVRSVALGRPSVKEGGSVVVPLWCLPGDKELLGSCAFPLMVFRLVMVLVVPELL